MMRESKIEKDSVKLAKDNGWYSFKILSQLVKGLPDRCFIGFGRVVFIEYKTATSKLSPLQLYIHKIFADRGITVHVARSPADTMEILNNAY